MSEDVTIDGMRLSPTVACAYRYDQFRKELALDYGEAEAIAGLIVASAVFQSKAIAAHVAQDVADLVAVALAKYAVTRVEAQGQA